MPLPLWAWEKSMIAKILIGSKDLERLEVLGK